jgi:AraC family transcriptional regulator of adaptative response / DNA-3-methyladenine glycosylase II
VSEPAEAQRVADSRVGIALSMVSPFDGEAMLSFLGKRAVTGVESFERGEDRITFGRTVRLAHGPACLTLVWAAGVLSVQLHPSDGADTDDALRRVRHLCDLDADPAAIDGWLARDERLRPLVARFPGLRVPGAVDPHELAFRTMIGQQISLAGAANCAAKIAARYGDPLAGPPGSGLHRLFPTAAALAVADPETLPMPRARGRAFVELAAALADGSIDLSGAVPVEEARRGLLACRGIGHWTADYIAMRALHAPDILLDTDLVIKRELIQRGLRDTDAWSPYRSYATMHLWRSYVV